jgi:AraC-like DNA-binding protein
MADANATKTGKFGFIELQQAMDTYAASARCENDLDREVVLERMRQEFGVESPVLLRRGFDKAYRRIVEGV